MSLVFERLALYCIAHVYIMSGKALRLMGAPGQEEGVLGTHADWFTCQR